MTERVLASWNEGPARRAVLNYVRGATTPGAAFVEPADRVATFDNDGTLWVEQPIPPQLDFVFRTCEEVVKADPSLQGFFEDLATQEPEAVATLLEAFARSWAGVRVLGRRHDFMRVFAEETWGILKEDIIGSAAAYTYTGGRIVRSHELLGGLDLGSGKPEHIFAHTGRLPAFAGGDADVDIEMRDSATFALLVRHDDDQREYAYTKGAEASLARAEQLGWTVVSMKNDWTTLL
ncbi:hypothetical protein ACFWWM_41815 [Streptomyces sp. NPDC058682]|uniref:hypothetical protein n=1 Tax=Streptomyces sp. NPDC058682 TaxID=3346596 RepID=UPI00365885B8